MGLDMYLTGKEYYSSCDPAEQNTEADVLCVVQVATHKLGYWRKHANLHGAVVKTFANGVDECQEITLTDEKLLRLIEMVKNKQLPHTTGFFFGNSYGTDEEMQEDIAILTKALDWLREDSIMRQVIYQASW